MDESKQEEQTTVVDLKQAVSDLCDLLGHMCEVLIGDTWHPTMVISIIPYDNDPSHVEIGLLDPSKYTYDEGRFDLRSGVPYKSFGYYTMTRPASQLVSRLRVRGQALPNKDDER